MILSVFDDSFTVLGLYAELLLTFSSCLLCTAVTLLAFICNFIFLISIVVFVQVFKVLMIQMTVSDDNC